MDVNDLNFNNFLQKVNKLENIINNNIKDKEIAMFLYRKTGLYINGIDSGYRELLVEKLLEDLINNEIFYLIE